VALRWSYLDKEHVCHGKGVQTPGIMGVGFFRRGKIVGRMRGFGISLAAFNRYKMSGTIHLQFVALTFQHGDHFSNYPEMLGSTPQLRYGYG